MVLEPPVEADHSGALLLFPCRARSPYCSCTSPSCSCLQGVQCGIDYLNTSSINAPSMGGLVIGGKTAIHLPLAGLCFWEANSNCFLSCLVVFSHSKAACVVLPLERASSNLLKPVSSVRPESRPL